MTESKILIEVPQETSKNQDKLKTLVFDELQKLPENEKRFLMSLEIPTDEQRRNCKICNLPSELRILMYYDYFYKNFTYEDLSEKYTRISKEIGENLEISLTNLSNHFKNHLSDNFVPSPVKHVEADEINALLAIKSEDETDGKSIIQLVEEGVIDNIKAITKAILLSKVRRLHSLWNYLKQLGDVYNKEVMKIHTEVNILENDIYKVSASAVKDFFLDASSNYDKALFVVQDLAGKLFMFLQQKEIDYNGQQQKLEALREIRNGIASLFDEYEKEVDTVDFRIIKNM